MRNLIAVCAVLVALQPPKAMAVNFLDDVGNAIGQGARDREKSFEKGVGDTRKTIEKGVHDIGNAGQTGTQDIGKTLENAAHDTGKAIEKAVQDIGYNLTVHPSDAKTDSPPYYVSLQADCPSSKNKATWRTYLSEPTRQNSVVGVQFWYANSLELPRALGGIDPSACYAITFDPKKGFGGHRTFSYSRMNTPEYHDLHIHESGLPGNPADYQINVDGVLLRYNDGGEVYDRRGRIAGTMVCYLANDCEQYKYTPPPTMATAGK